MIQPPPQGFPKVAAAVAAALGLVAATAFGTAPLRDVALPPLHTVVENLDIDAVPAALHAAGDDAQPFVRSERVQRGDTLAAVLDRLGATDGEFHRLVASDRQARRLLQLQPGRTVTASVDATGRVQSLHYRYGGLDADSVAAPQAGGRITVRRADSGIETSEEPIVLERQVVMGAAEIRTSLFAAIDAAGIPEAVATKVADIMDGEVDFNRDLRRGDQLHVVYEVVREADSLDPPLVSRILGLDFSVNGRRHEALWFERSPGQGEYFAFDGRSLRKAFLQHPVEFSRISSGFSSSRMHPILGYTREHRGVDFAAPTGTKVRSSGDGVVAFVGQKRGYGNVIEIRHRNGIETLYAHLSRFAEGLAAGRKVSQGETIGYVGSTGYSTGPHLHYEFKLKGDAVNPLKVALPASPPLEAAERARFAASTAGLRTRLAQLDGVRLARFD